MRYPSNVTGLFPVQARVRDAFWRAVYSTLVLKKPMGHGENEIARHGGFKLGSVGSALKALRARQLIPKAMQNVHEMPADWVDLIPEEYMVGSPPPPEPDPTPEPVAPSTNGGREAWQEDGNHAELATVCHQPVHNLEELLATAHIDLTDWVVERWSCNRYETTVRLGEKLVVQPMWQVKASMVRRVARKVVSEIPDIHPVEFHLPPVKPRHSRPAAPLQRALLLADLHIGFLRDGNSGRLRPLHDRVAIDTVFQAAQLWQPDLIVVMGDLLDLAMVQTKWEQSPENAQTLQATLNEAGYVLARLRQHTTRQILQPGNHEARLKKALWGGLAYLYGLKPANQPDVPPILSLENLLGLKTIGVEYAGDYPSSTWLSHGLEVGHGERVSSRSGGTVAKLVSEDVASEVVAHVHRTEMASRTYHRHPDLGPLVVTAASIGCLAKLDGEIPPATLRRNWSQGFGRVWYSDDRHHLELVGIERGSAILDGQVVVGKDYAADMEACVGRP